MTEFRMIYMTAPNAELAESIASALLEERLVACVNIIPAVRSLYWWQGKIERDQEVSMFAKSKESLVERVIERVRSLHTYSVPCVVALPIEQGNPAYLEWLGKETTS